MTRDRKALIALKRQETDDTFYADDSELQEADQEVLRELGRDALPNEEEYENQ